MNNGQSISRSEPVTLTDVRTVLGQAGTAAPLAALAKLANPWSAFKPYAFGHAMSHANMAPGGSEWYALCRANNFGLTPCPLLWPDTGSVGEGFMSDCVPMWGGWSAPAANIRLGDFAGYNHAALPPRIQACINTYSDLSINPVDTVSRIQAEGNRPEECRPVISGTSNRFGGSFAWWIFQAAADGEITLKDFTMPDGTPWLLCYPTIVVATDTVAIVAQSAADLQSYPPNVDYDQTDPASPQRLPCQLVGFNWAKVDPEPFIRAGYFTVLAGIYPEFPEANTVHTGTDLYETIQLQDAPRPYSIHIGAHTARDTFESQANSYPIEL